MLKIGTLYQITIDLHFFHFEDYDKPPHKAERFPQGSILLVLENYGLKGDKIIFLETASNRKIFHIKSQLALEFYEEIL